MPGPTNEQNPLLATIKKSGVLNPNATLEQLVNISANHAINPGGLNAAWELVTKDFVYKGSMPEELELGHVVRPIDK
ncbi:hypothetical protein KHA93_02715 [Bacillus sp. FJAT-49732]|uniref:Uncharacterized protein n=1 Tax=Lederbergia citrisecunda TaxID=2833583 RepID=A0A942YKG2_9BACI|nr:hypothetical protein [Lederbergia citrisecunda]MBS4198560.1 hypothetical protein [Lederbergia citrisecunda]